MSAARRSRLLLRLYPPAWRARYGDELVALLELSGGDRRPSWRAQADVVLNGLRERLRSAGLRGDGVPPSERVRAGSLLVLCAWTLFVVGGAGVQKASEHWQDATPAGQRGLPSAAFDVLVVAAALGSALILAGIALVLPSLLVHLRRGGWASIRRPVVRAVLVTVPAVAATDGLVVWAHRLSSAQRNGGDALYGGVWLLWALLVVACLVAWVAAAVAVARRLDLPPLVLRIEGWLGVAVTAAMAAMTVAAVVWWVGLVRVAPWFFNGRPLESAATPVDPKLVVACSLMLAATLLGAAGAVRAGGGLRGLDGRRSPG